MTHSPGTVVRNSALSLDRQTCGSGVIWALAKSLTRACRSVQHRQRPYQGRRQSWPLVHAAPPVILEVLWLRWV